MHFTDCTNHKKLSPDVIMRCVLRMYSEYRLLAMLTVCTDRTITSIALNSAAVLNMTEIIWHSIYSALTFFLHITLQTDDKGVFSITLSEEYSIMAKTFNLTEEEVWDLTLNSINYIFENDSVKNALKETWKAEKQKIMSVNK